MFISDIILEASVEAAGDRTKIVLFLRDTVGADGLMEHLQTDAGIAFARPHPDEVEVWMDGRSWRGLDAATAAAARIREGLGLKYCEPDILAGVLPDEGAGPEQRGLESVDGLVRGCWADPEEDLQNRKDWALSLIRADRAWAFAERRKRPRRGSGIVIAQPDTGLTPHPELRDVPLRSPRNFFGDRPENDVTDPMTGNGNPGHGTATSSVVVSRSSLAVTGSAPSATLMPIRAIESVVRVSQVNVARAIDHAVDNGAHIITMSLGGLWSYALWRALERAVAADVIVLAAAGNCVQIVVWPARFENCIAVAGVDQHCNPWIGTCRGPEVDIAAPAQNVYCADAVTGDVRQGQGTSFAVALTAGAAACWLAYHGRTGAISEARKRGETLQAMFRRLIKATARRPGPNWDEYSMGPGVLDCEALLKAPFDLGRATEGPVGVVSATNAFYSLTTLALERGVSLGTVSADAGADSAVAESAALLRARVDHPLQTGDASRSTAPLVVRAPPIGSFADRFKLASLRAQIAAADRHAEGGRLESLLEAETAGGLELSSAAATRIVDRVVDQARQVAAGRGVDPRAVTHAADIFSRHATDALVKVGGAAGQPLNEVDRRILEAIVIADGSRPSFLLEDGRVSLKDPFIGRWIDRIAPIEQELRNLALAVGRIQPENGHSGLYIGTGVLVDQHAGFVLTNFHVLDDAQKKFLVPMVRVDQWTVRVLEGLEIDFVGEAATLDRNCYRIVEAKLHPESGRGFGRLDAVLLRIEPNERSGSLPPPVVFSAEAATFNRKRCPDLTFIGRA